MARRAGAIRHQGTHIHIARGDYAVKGGRNFLEPLQVFQASYVFFIGLDRGFRRHHVRLSRHELQPIGVRFLLGDRVVLHQLLPALHADSGQFQIRPGLPENRLRLRQGADGLPQLLVHVRRLDLNQQLPRLHGLADFHEVALDIPVRARIDRRLLIATHGPWEDEIRDLRGPSHRHHRDLRQAGFHDFRLRLQCGLLSQAGDDPRHQQDPQHRGEGQQKRLQAHSVLLVR